MDLSKRHLQNNTLTLRRTSVHCVSVTSKRPLSLRKHHHNQPLLLLLPREQNQWNQDSLEPENMLQRK